MTELLVDFNNSKLFWQAMRNPTCRKIIKLLSLFKNQELVNISNLARQLGQTEANASSAVKQLQKAGLITPNFVVGKHGVSKNVQLTFSTISIQLKLNNNHQKEE